MDTDDQGISGRGRQVDDGPDPRDGATADRPAGTGRGPDAGLPTHAPGELHPDADVDAARRVTKRYAEDLLARGEAVEEGEELVPGATHEIVREHGEPVAVRRRRFSAL